MWCVCSDSLSTDPETSEADRQITFLILLYGSACRQAGSERSHLFKALPVICKRSLHLERRPVALTTCRLWRCNPTSSSDARSEPRISAQRRQPGPTRTSTCRSASFCFVLLQFLYRIHKTNTIITPNSDLKLAV